MLTVLTCACHPALMTPCSQPTAGQDSSMTSDVDTTDHWPQSRNAGYLSSLSALETGVGLQLCPWLIDVPAGRQVNVTLLSFSSSSRLAAAGGMTMSSCEWSVVIREGNVTTHLPGCAEASAVERQQHFYTSHQRGTPLTIYLRPTSTATTPRSQLLLHFHGSPLYFRAPNILHNSLPIGRLFRLCVDIDQKYSLQIWINKMQHTKKLTEQLNNRFTSLVGEMPI